MPDPQPNEDCVIVHDKDLDGHGAGYAAYRWFGDEATYITHGDHSTPPEVEKGTDLFLLDTAYSPEKLRWLLDRHNQLVIIDHHATNAREFLRSDLAAERLETRLEDDWFISSKGPVTYYYSSTESAATLAWDFFFGSQHQGPGRGGFSPPALLRHIKDYDLWNFDMEGTDAVSVALDRLGLSIDTIAKYVEDVESLIEIGEPMIQYRDSLLRRFADRADIRTNDLPGIGETTYAIVNATVCRSKLAEHILDTENKVDLVVMYRVAAAGDVHVSLRSNENVDASAMATELGGGGHAKSAGHPSTLDELATIYK